MNAKSAVGAAEASGTKLLRVREVCEVTGLSRSFVYLALERGDLRQVRFGRARRVDIDDLNAWIERSRVA